ATALWDDRTLVRTWAMRGTLHLLRSADLGLYVGAQAASKPRYETAPWRKAFGMTSAEAVAVLDAIRTALDGPPLTRDELADTVGELLGDARLGEAVRGSFGTMPKLAALRGDVCSARPAGQRVRFTRPDLWLGSFAAVTPPRAALAGVMRRHLAVYGPSTREEFARWFGMASAAQAGRELQALGAEVAEVAIDGLHAGWMLAADVAEAAAARPRGTVSLLPAFDQYVVAAPRVDSPVLAGEHSARVYRRQGWLSPVLLVDGRIAGVWKHEHRHGTLTVEIDPFGDPGAEVRSQAAAEAARLARYLGAEELDVSWT
ncbi:MAG: DNA glycosylase AlkZ-like family protein, partial [Solirubrobacteraceae bacterium]